MSDPGFVSYSVKADKAFADQVARALDAVTDLRIPFQLIAKDFYKSQKAIFNLKGPGQYEDFKGKKIGQIRKAPLQVATADRTPISKGYDSYTPYQYYKEKKTGLRKGYPLLKFSGVLEKSVTQIGGPGNITDIQKRSLTLGTTVPYGKYHQSDDPRKKIPLRKFLFIGPESSRFAANKDMTGRLERWNNIINQYILRVLGSTLGEATGSTQGSGDGAV